MIRVEPIPAELWQRLAALDARCDFSMERYDANRPTKMLQSRRNYEREWRVEIGLKGDPRGPMSVMGAGLKGVLEHALKRAEERGWHLPEGGGVGGGRGDLK